MTFKVEQAERIPLLLEASQEEIAQTLRDLSQRVVSLQRRMLEDRLEPGEKETLQDKVILLQSSLEVIRDNLGLPKPEEKASKSEKKKDKNKKATPDLKRNFMIMGSFVTASLAMRYFSSNVVLYTILTTLAMSASKTVMRQLNPELQIAFHATTLPLGFMITRLVPNVDASTMCVSLFLGTLGRTIREIILKKPNPEREQFCEKVQSVWGRSSQRLSSVGNQTASWVGYQGGRIGRLLGLFPCLPSEAPSLV